LLESLLAQEGSNLLGVVAAIEPSLTFQMGVADLCGNLSGSFRFKNAGSDLSQDHVEFWLAVLTFERASARVITDAVVIDLINEEEAFWDVVEGPDDHTVSGMEVYVLISAARGPRGRSQVPESSAPGAVLAASTQASSPAGQYSRTDR
jgi:hypothetical protein